MSNLLRRLRNLEARLTDASGLVPHSQPWLDYWSAKMDGIILGEERGRIPLAVVDALLKVALADNAPISDPEPPHRE